MKKYWVIGNQRDYKKDPIIEVMRSRLPVNLKRRYGYNRPSLIQELIHRAAPLQGASVQY
jgi:hypothetical protein